MCDQTNSESTEGQTNSESTEGQTNSDQQKSSDVYLIEKLLNNDLIKGKVEMWSKGGVLNLVQPEWKSVLYNNPIYQKHKNGQVEYSTKRDSNKHYVTHNINDWNNHFNILVAGYFRVKPASDTSSTSIVVYNCAPLAEIGKVMSKNAINNASFFVHSCGGVCAKCRSDENVANDNLWCVQSVQAFLPDGFCPTSRNYAEAMYKSPTLGIATITIHMKYDFSNMSKVGGVIKSICFVQERLLQDEEECNEKVLTLDEPIFTLPKKRKFENEDVILALPTEKATNEKYDVKVLKM